MSDKQPQDDRDDADDDANAEGEMDGDNPGDSVEIPMDDMINELEQAPGSPARDMSARRRLEELMEERRAAAELEDFEDYDV